MDTAKDFAVFVYLRKAGYTTQGGAVNSLVRLSLRARNEVK
jgi:hypothetical protein